MNAKRECTCGVGNCIACYPNQGQFYSRQLNQRPPSYGTGGPEFPEKPKLSVEQVHAELRRIAGLAHADSCMSKEVRLLIDQLPSPDVVEECAKMYYSRIARMESFEAHRKATRDVLRRYLELKGLPADPELEGK